MFNILSHQGEKKEIKATLRFHITQVIKKTVLFLPSLPAIAAVGLNALAKAGGGKASKGKPHNYSTSGEFTAMWELSHSPCTQ